MTKAQQILVASGFFIVSVISVASWWSPFAWTEKEVVQSPVVQVPTPASTDDKRIEDLEQQVKELQKNMDTKVTSVPGNFKSLDEFRAPPPTPGRTP